MTSTAPRTLSEKVRRGALLSIANALLLRLTSIFITAIVAHILSPRDFGAYAVALTAYAIVTAIGRAGVASCLIRADLDIDSLAPTMVTVSLVGCTILAVAMAAFAKPIAAELGSTYATGPVRVTALTVLLAGVFAVPGAQLVREFKQERLLLADVISFVPSNAALLILARYGSGAMAFAWSRLIGEFVVGFVWLASVPKIYRPGFERDALPVLLRFGVPFGTANFVNYILLNVDNALVGHLMGAVKLGTYVLAFNIASWPYTLLGAMINNVAMPAFSRVKQDAKLLRDAITSALHDLALIVMPICGVLMAVARPLILTLYGAKWIAAAQVLTVLSIYSAISMVCLLFASVLAAIGRTKLLLVVQLIWLGALAPAMALGVHWNGIVGAAFAHIAVIGPIVLPCYLFAMKKTTGANSGSLGRAVFPALLSSFLAALAVRATAAQFSNSLVQLTTGLLAGGLIYIVAVAPHAITLLNRGKSSGLRMKRIARLYSIAARIVGLPGDTPPKHTARRRYKDTDKGDTGNSQKASVPSNRYYPPADYQRNGNGAGPGGSRGPSAPNRPESGVPSEASRSHAAPTKPYGRIVIFTLLDDKVAYFDWLAEQISKEVWTREPGTVIYGMHFVPNAPLQRILYEVYRDRPAFDIHEHRPYIRRFAAECRSCVLATNVIELNLKHAKVAQLTNWQYPGPVQRPVTQERPLRQYPPPGQTHGSSAGLPRPSRLQQFVEPIQPGVKWDKMPAPKRRRYDDT